MAVDLKSRYLFFNRQTGELTSFLSLMNALLPLYQRQLMVICRNGCGPELFDSSTFTRLATVASVDQWQSADALVSCDNEKKLVTAHVIDDYTRLKIWALPGL